MFAPQYLLAVTYSLHFLRTAICSIQYQFLIRYAPINITSRIVPFARLFHLFRYTFPSSCLWNRGLSFPAAVVVVR